MGAAVPLHAASHQPVDLLDTPLFPLSLALSTPPYPLPPHPHPPTQTTPREQQEELLKRKNQETLARLTALSNGGTSGPASTSGRMVTDTVAYRSLADLPMMRQLQIDVGDACGACGRAAQA
jgi:hypothetical protein